MRRRTRDSGARGMEREAANSQKSEKLFQKLPAKTIGIPGSAATQKRGGERGTKRAGKKKMENGRIKKAAAKEKVAGKNAVNLFGMRLLFLFSFFIFCCFSFTPGRAQETPVAAYTSADT